MTGWYTYGEMRIGQGRDAAVEFLEGNAPVSVKAEAQLYEKLKIPKASRIVQRETPAETDIDATKTRKTKS